jgi:hypothetical protein
MLALFGLAVTAFADDAPASPSSIHAGLATGVACCRAIAAGAVAGRGLGSAAAAGSTEAHSARRSGGGASPSDASESSSVVSSPPAADVVDTLAAESRRSF